MVSASFPKFATVLQSLSQTAYFLLFFHQLRKRGKEYNRFSQPRVLPLYSQKRWSETQIKWNAKSSQLTRGGLPSLSQFSPQIVSFFTLLTSGAREYHLKSLFGKMGKLRNIFSWAVHNCKLLCEWPFSPPLDAF